MKVILIAAIGKNREIGLNNELIWRISDDMQHFREQTRDQTVIMGMNTYKSIGRILKHRTNIILSRSDIKIPNAIVATTVLDVLLYAKSMLLEKVFVIGGGSIYKEFMPFATELYLTKIDAEEPKADSFFPEYEQDFYERHNVPYCDEKTGLNYSFTRYIKKDD